VDKEKEERERRMEIRDTKLPHALKRPDQMVGYVRDSLMVRLSKESAEIVP
jgi:hypothetical protein